MQQRDIFFTYVAFADAASAWLYAVNQTTTASWSMHALSLNGCAQHTNHNDRDDIMTMSTRNPKTDSKDGYKMISLPAGMLVGKNLYPLDRRVLTWVGTTYTRVQVGKIYPHNYHYYQ